MNVEMTLPEAELLIAVLTGAESAFAIANPPLVEALNDLRQWRTALMQAYLRGRIASGRALNVAGTPDAVPSAGEQKETP